MFKFLRRPRAAAARRPLPLFEPLEGRQLLAADDVIFRPVQINFQPAGMGSVPAHFRADLGRAYGTRGNGLQYGWDRDISSQMVNRDNPRSPKEQYDTFARMDGDPSWSIAVPNGRYYVTLVGGDVNYSDGQDLRMSIEGRHIMRGKPEAVYEWIEGSDFIEVTDGKLTVSNSELASKNTLDYLTIRRAAPAPDYPVKNDVSWAFADSSLDVPHRFVEGAGVELNGKVYVMGGYDNAYDGTSTQVDILDLKTKSWSRGAPLPGPETHGGVATDGKYIYFVGGQSGPQESTDLTDKAWKYYPDKDLWIPYLSLPEVRAGGTLAYADNALHYFGGVGANRITNHADHFVLKYNTPDPHWERAAPMPRSTDHVTSAVLDGKIYVIGGEHGHEYSYVPHYDVQAYDLATGTWSYKAPLPVAVSHAEYTTFVYDGQIWTLNGQTSAEDLTTQVASYDPVADLWTVHPGTPEKRKGGVAFQSGGKLYYVGGEREVGGEQLRTMVGTFV